MMPIHLLNNWKSVLEGVLAQVQDSTGYDAPANRLDLRSPHFIDGTVTMWKNLTDPSEATWQGWLGRAQAAFQAMDTDKNVPFDLLERVGDALYEVGVRFGYQEPILDLEAMPEETLRALFDRMRDDGLPKPGERLTAEKAEQSQTLRVESLAKVVLRLVVIDGRYYFPNHLEILKQEVLRRLTESGVSDSEAELDLVMKMVRSQMENARVNPINGNIIPEGYVSAIQLRLPHLLTGEVMDGRELMKGLEYREGFQSIKDWAVKLIAQTGHVYYYVNPANFKEAFGDYATTSVSVEKGVAVVQDKNRLEAAWNREHPGVEMPEIVTLQYRFQKGVTYNNQLVAGSSGAREEGNNQGAVVVETRGGSPSITGVEGQGKVDIIEKIIGKKWAEIVGLERAAMAGKWGVDKAAAVKFGSYALAPFVSDLQSREELKKAWEVQHPDVSMPDVITIQYAYGAQIDSMSQVGIVGGSAGAREEGNNQGAVVVEMSGERASIVDVKGVGKADVVEKVVGKQWAVMSQLERAVVAAKWHVDHAAAVKFGSYALAPFVSDLQNREELKKAWEVQHPDVSMPDVITIQYAYGAHVDSVNQVKILAGSAGAREEGNNQGAVVIDTSGDRPRIIDPKGKGRGKILEIIASSKGTARVEAFAWPWLAGFDAVKAMVSGENDTVMARGLEGGAAFMAGSLLWRSLQGESLSDMPIGGIAKEYAIFSGANVANNVALQISGLESFVARTPIIDSLTKRILPMWLGLAGIEYVHTGKFDATHVGITGVEIAMASTIVDGVVAAASEVGMVGRSIAWLNQSRLGRIGYGAIHFTAVMGVMELANWGIQNENMREELIRFINVGQLYDQQAAEYLRAIRYDIEEEGKRVSDANIVRCGATLLKAQSAWAGARTLMAQVVDARDPNDELGAAVDRSKRRLQAFDEMIQSAMGARYHPAVTVEDIGYIILGN